MPKAAANVARQGVSFEEAQAVFRDAFALDWMDDSHAEREERCVTIGMADGRPITVAHALRGKTIRIMSARGAEPHEQRRDHDAGL